MRSLLVPLVAVALLGTTQHLAVAAPPVELQGDRLTLALSAEQQGAIVSLVDRASGAQFVALQTAPQLFRLALSQQDEPGGKPLYLTSRDARRFAVDVDGSVATLRYDGLGTWPIRVAATASIAKKDPLVRWRLSVEIPEGLVLEEVQFPLVTLRAPLGKEGEDDAIVFGHTKGGVARNPAAMRVGSRLSGQQSGSLAAQFGCCYDGMAGFYTAACDSRGYPKEFEARRTAEGVEISWRLPCYAEKTYVTDFDLVMTTFSGTDPLTPTDWRDAADIYKQWALEQPWCATTYADRKDIPAWMKQGPAMVRFNREWLADPSRIERWISGYWKKHYPDAPLITAYWGWEKVGSWVTPDYFPAFPSDEQFTELVAKLCKQGCHAFPWPSGYHWTLTYREQPDGSFYWDDRKRFDEVARAHAVHLRDGKLYLRAPSWLHGGDTACMCPGDPWTVHWWNEDICVPLARRGCEMIQVDQVVGGRFPFCYARNHPHPAGPGPWMTDVFVEQLRSMYAAMREIEPDSVVCFEEPNEQFNHLVGIQDYRDCEARGEWASVFNYLYHEFLPTFQSNPREGDTVMAAYCLAGGQIPHLKPSPRDLEERLLVNGDFERRSDGGDPFVGWQQVRAYGGREWKGRAFADEDQRHGGSASLRLENTAADDAVQVSQNVMVTEPDGGFGPGRTYRLSACLKTDSMARPNGVNFCFLTTGVKSVGRGGRLPFPAPEAGWSRVAADFTVPEGAQLLRIMIHLDGPARAWVDDVLLEEVLPDGSTREARYSALGAHARFMRRWVELYHGEGRPWLAMGRMLHPPKLTCGTITYRDRPTPAVLHNAFRAADGAEAVVLANPTPERQPVTLSWHGRQLSLELEPGQVILQR